MSAKAGKQLFIGSAFKTFVLHEALRQADSPQVVQTITQQQLTLDASVWSPGQRHLQPAEPVWRRVGADRARGDDPAQ